MIRVLVLGVSWKMVVVHVELGKSTGRKSEEAEQMVHR